MRIGYNSPGTVFGGALVRAVVSMWLLLLFSSTIAGFGAFGPQAEAGEGVPPKLSHEIISRLTVREGTKNFRLSCPVTGRPSPLILWKKDGEIIGVAWNRFKTLNDAKTLRIKNLILEDTGQYTCEAVNGFGRKDVQFTLVVYGKDEPEPHEGEFTFPPGSTEVRPFWIKPAEMASSSGRRISKQRGQDVVLKCPANGLPSPDIQWFRNNVPLNGGRGSRPNKYSYHLKSLSEADTGTYVCRVYNAHGAINATFPLRVSSAQDPPEFQTHPLNTTARVGEPALFQCEVRSATQPHIKWLKHIDADTQLEDNSSLFNVKGMDFVVLKHESKTTALPNHTFRHNLKIPSVRENDRGYYVCVVTSTAGHIIYKFAHLRVLPAVSRTPLSDAFPSAPIAVGLCVGFFLLIMISCAIFFFRKSIQNKPETVGNVLVRPPPPSFQPPSLPGKHTPSPYYSNSRVTGMEHATASAGSYYRDNGRYIRTSERQKQALKPPPLSCPTGEYHLYDAQARVPLNSSFAPDERDLYETTPQPYEIDYEHSDIEYGGLPEGGRLQPYPSLYSCR